MSGLANEVDNVVEMKLGESIEDSFKRAVDLGCAAVMRLEMPSDEKIQEGLAVVRGYARTSTSTVKKPKYRLTRKRSIASS